MPSSAANIEIPRAVNVLGLPLRPVDTQALIDLAISRTRAGASTFACYANAHTMNMASADSKYRRVLEHCDLLYADGASVVWSSRFASERLPPRSTAADYFPRLAAAAADANLSLYLLGGRPGIAVAAGKALQQKYPSLRIAGTHDGHFELSESSSIIAQINEAKPDILAVGMSSPRQEFWLAEHADALHVPTRWCVGALFDYLAGIERRAPQWLCRMHAEWFYRLCMDPVGKWRRYLVGNPKFVWHTLRWALAQRREGIGSAALPGIKT